MGGIMARIRQGRPHLLERRRILKRHALGMPGTWRHDIRLLDSLLSRPLERHHNRQANHLRNLGEDLKQRAHTPQTVLLQDFPCG